MNESKTKAPGRLTVQRLLGKAEKLLKVGSETADVLVHLGTSGLTVPGVASVGLRVLHSVRTATAQSPSRFFKGWKRLEDWGYAESLFHACQRHVGVTPAEGVKDDAASLCNLDGITIGWEKYASDNIWGPYVQDGNQREAAYHALGRAVWDTVGPRAILSIEDTDHGNKARFQASEAIDDLASEQGRKLVERIQGFLKVGSHRSILIAGRPGVGKSCMMRYIAARVGGFSLRVPTSDLDDLTLRQLDGAIQILRPDSVLIDDMDRLFKRYDDDDSNRTSLVLDIVEHIARTAKVFVVSANYSDRFPLALLRPGRFDEIEVVDQMDEAVLNGIIGEDVGNTLRKKLHTMPVAYVVEFAKRKEAMGAKAAFEELEDLKRRAKGLRARNKRFVRERKVKGVPKTAAQRIRQYEREAASLDLRAAKLKERAQARRERAQAARDKAEGKPQKPKQRAPKRRRRRRRTAGVLAVVRRIGED